MDEDVRVVDKANPAFQESLQAEVEPDPMEGEQTWPTEDELQEAEGKVCSPSSTLVTHTTPALQYTNPNQ